MRITFSLLLLLCFHSVAQDSKSKVFDELKFIENNVAKQEISDTAYLKRATLLLHNIFGYSEFDSHIHFFKGIIDKDKHHTAYLREYYRLQYRNADAQLKAGKSLYYLSQLKKVLEKGDQSPLPLIIAKSQINIYCNNDDSASAIEVYNNILPSINNLDKKWKQIPINIDYLWDAHDLLQRILILACACKRTDIVDKIQPIFQQNFKVIFTNKKYTSQTEVYFDSLCYLFGSWFALSAQKKLMETDIVRSRVKYMLEDSAMKSHPYISSIQSSYLRNNYDYFLDYNLNLDSAKKYLELFETICFNEGRILDKILFLQKRIDVLKLENNFPELIQSLELLVKLQDTLNKTISKDLQESQFAQAEADETKDELLKSEQIRQRAVLYNRTLIGVVILVMVIVLLLYQWIRLRQKNKLLHYQQSLARNLHDETGPMLLYAKILAQKQIKQYDDNDAKELESHLASTMEAIRGLSHDLKSDKLQSSNKLFLELEQLLAKLKKNLGILVKLQNLFPESELSFFQYNELKNILNELITNSVKHSNFDTIGIEFKGEKKRLIIKYYDNGQGFEQKASDGVGLHNIAERAKRINAELVIHNHFPDGYFIEIILPIK